MRVGNQIMNSVLTSDRYKKDKFDKYLGRLLWGYPDQLNEFEKKVKPVLDASQIQEKDAESTGWRDGSLEFINDPHQSRPPNKFGIKSNQPQIAFGLVNTRNANSGTAFATKSGLQQGGHIEPDVHIDPLIERLPPATETPASKMSKPTLGLELDTTGIERDSVQDSRNDIEEIPWQTEDTIGPRIVIEEYVGEAHCVQIVLVE